MRLREAAPVKASALHRKLESEVDRSWTEANVKNSSRHWFEVSHVTYLRAIDDLLQEATP
jgi:hypothetical protein